MSSPLDPTEQYIIKYLQTELAKDPETVFYLDEEFADKPQMNDYHDELVQLERGKIIQGYNNLHKGGGETGVKGVPHIGYKIKILK